jgi:hypothetical protein
MPDSTFGQGRYVLCFGEEIVKDRLSLSGATISTYTISNLSALSTNAYQDQDAYMLGPGATAGRVFRIVSNTTTAITFQEDVQTAGVTAGDSMVFGARGIRPTTYNILLGVKDEFTPATPKNTYERPAVAGSGLSPYDTILLKTDFESSVPFLLTDFRFPFTFFGDEYVTGTDVTSGGGSTLSSSCYAGETIVTLTAVTNYTATDLVQIGESTLAEVRKITAIDTTNKRLTLDYPLRKNHGAAAACNEVTTPFTHVCTVKDSGIYWTIQNVFDQPTTPTVYENHGDYSKSLEIRSEDGGYVTGTIEYQAMTDSVNGTKQTPSSTGVPAPYLYDHLSSGISLNGVVYAQCRNWGIKWTRDAESLRYASSTYGPKPAGSASGKISYIFDAVVDASSRNFIDLIRAGTEFTLTLPLVRTAATDTLTLTLNNVTLEEAAHPMSPEGATVKVSTKAGAESSTVTVVNNVPYFPMGVPV